MVAARRRACHPLVGRGRKVPTIGATQQERVTDLLTASMFGQRARKAKGPQDWRPW